MFEKFFTERAQKVMAFADQEAKRCNHEYVDTGHVLIALLIEGSGLAAFVLKKLGADLSKMRSELEKIDKPDPDTVTIDRLPQTPQVKKAIEYAIEEARCLGHNYVGTEHILLGLLRQPEKGKLSTANKILRNLKIKPKEVREEVTNLLGVGAGKRKERSVKCEIFEEKEYLKKPATATIEEEKDSPEKVKAAINEFLARIEFIEAQQSSVVVHALPHIIITKYTIYYRNKE